jgi:hypothetical protein
MSHMNASSELEQLRRTVLTRGTQSELGIAGRTIRVDGQSLRFRLDPGSLFERHGWLCAAAGGWCSTGISQRHGPDEPLAWAAGVTAPPDVALRIAVQDARGCAADLPHWLSTCQPGTGQWQWSSAWYFVRRAAAVDAMDTAVGRARETGIVHFVFREPDRIICATSPPGNDRCFSVTPAGDWSMHWLRHTRPLDSAPKHTALTVAGDAARAAARDVPVPALGSPRGTGAVPAVSAAAAARRPEHRAAKRR